jgi:hypothetical protein
MIGPSFLLVLSQPEIVRGWIRRLLGDPAVPPRARPPAQ